MQNSKASSPVYASSTQPPKSKKTLSTLNFPLSTINSQLSTFNFKLPQDETYHIIAYCLKPPVLYNGHSTVDVF